MPDPSTSQPPTLHDAHYYSVFDPWAVTPVAGPSTFSPPLREGLACITEVPSDSEWSDNQCSDKTVAPTRKGKEVAFKRPLVNEVYFSSILQSRHLSDGNSRKVSLPTNALS